MNHWNHINNFFEHSWVCALKWTNDCAPKHTQRGDGCDGDNINWLVFGKTSDLKIREISCCSLCSASELRDRRPGIKSNLSSRYAVSSQIYFEELPMRSAFVTPTTAMLFSTRDFPFFRKQKNNVSNFKTSRPLHGAISRLLRLPGRFSFC